MTQHDQNGSEIFASLRYSQINSDVITYWRMNEYAVSRGKRLENLGGFESLRSLHTFIGVLRGLKFLHQFCISKRLRVP